MDSVGWALLLTDEAHLALLIVGNDGVISFAIPGIDV
jgi:hypothetical protein